MKFNVRTFAVSFLSSGLIALGSSVALAQSINNIDNTSPGESGHGAGCSNYAGGCRPAQVSTAHGAYQPSNDLGIGATPAPSANTAISGDAGTPFTTCQPASSVMPGHCMTAGTNR